MRDTQHIGYMQRLYDGTLCAVAYRVVSQDVVDRLQGQQHLAVAKGGQLNEQLQRLSDHVFVACPKSGRTATHVQPTSCTGRGTYSPVTGKSSLSPLSWLRI